MPTTSRPVLRFAPSPNGPLHLGHALSALTGWAWAQRLGGRFLVRIEDIDPERSSEAYIEGIFRDLAWLGVPWEEPELRQSQHLDRYEAAADRLAGLSWGAEDLPAAIGATTSREADGRYTPPYELVRSLTLFAAHAAGVPAIDTVFPAIADKDGLAAHVARARRDGFTGMLAIHPAQVPVINAGFTPDDEEIAKARRIIAAFDANPGAGALALDGRMIDRPHLVQARHVLALAGALSTD